MVSVWPEYFDACAEKDFSVLAMGRQQRRRVQRMEIGDRVLFYVTHRLVFGAIASISGAHFEDKTPLWPGYEGADPLAWRVKTKPDVVPDDDHVLDARLIAPRMEYVKRWPPEDWPLAFQGLLHLIPKRDFQLIEHEMRRGRRRPDVSFVPDPRHGPHAREAQYAGRPGENA